MARALLLLASCVALLSCGEKSSTKKEEREASPAVEAPAWQVPVALSTPGDREHELTAGLVIKTDHPAAKGRPCLVFLAPRTKSTDPRLAYLWLGEASDGAWHPVTYKPTLSSEVVVTPLDLEEELPALSLQDPSRLKSKLSYLFVPTWGDSLAQSAPSEKDERREQVLELFQILTNEQAEMRKNRQYQHARYTDLTRELKQLENEARVLGLELHMNPIERPPRHAARLASTPVSAVRINERTESGLLVLRCEDPPLSAALPGDGLARSSDGNLEALTLQELASLCAVSNTRVKARFEFDNGPALNFVLELDKDQTAFPYHSLRAAAAPEAEVAKLENFDSAPLKMQGQGRPTLRVNIWLPKDKVSPGSTVVAAIDVQFQGVSEWLRLSELPIKMRERPADRLVPILAESEVVQWTAPPTREKLAPPMAEPLRTLETGEIIDSAVAGHGNYLVLRTRDPHRLRILDFRKEEWLGELPLPDESEGVSVAADAERLFIVNAQARTLTSYSLPNLEQVTTVRLAEEQPVRVAAGYSSTRSPICLLYKQSIELRDPVTLQPSVVGIRCKSTHSLALPLSGVGSVTWKSNTFRHPALHASPAGDQFSARVIRESSGQTWIRLVRRAGHWDLDNRQGIPHHDQVRLWRREAFLDSSGRSDWETRSRPGMGILLPAIGPGLVAFTHHFPTSPGRPFEVSYLPRPGAEPVLSSRGGLAALEGLLLRGHLEAGPASNLLVLPHHHKIVALGADRITFERFTPPKDKTLPTLAGPFPPATRGQEWKMQIEKPLELVSGPEGAAVQDGAIVWKVPANFEKAHAAFELSPGDSGITERLPVAVGGMVGATVRVGSEPEGDSAAVDTRALAFREGVDEILPAPSRPWAAVVSGGHRRISLVDLDKLDTVAKYESSRGMAAFALGPEALYVWHLNGPFLETRSLPDLAPGSVRALDPSLRLLALVSGPASGAAPPLALVEGAEDKVTAYQIDPASLELTPFTGWPPDIPVLGTRSATRPFDPNLPSSADGRTFVYGNRIFRRDEAGSIVATENARLRRNQRALCRLSPDGETFYVGGSALNLTTKNLWEPKIGKTPFDEDEGTILWPDLDGAYALAVTQEGKERDRESFRVRIQFLRFGSLEPAFEVGQLLEWDGFTRRLFSDGRANSRMLFSSRRKALLTVSADNTRIIGRRIPVPPAK